MLVFEKDIKKFYDSATSDIISAGKAKGQIKSDKVEKSFKQVFSYEGDVSKYQLLAWKFIVQAIETGRGKTVNGNSGGKTLWQSLESWVERENIKDKNRVWANREKEVKSLAYVISRKIHKLGNTNSTQFITRPTGTITDFINEKNISELLRNMGISAKAQIIDEIKNLKFN